MYKRLLLYSIDNSVGGGHILGQKLLVYKRLLLYSIDNSVENSLGVRPYPRTEAPGTETPEKRLYTI